jgi:3-oxoacyl-[acyl-carrier-protein] synthase III
VQPFVVNSHGRLVFPSNFLPDLDFSVIEDLDQLSSVIRRDFESKAPSGTDILNRVEAGGYASRHELMRDMALNLFWANRYAITMYDKRPTRWGDLSRRRDDVFLPILTPWEDSERKLSAVRHAFDSLEPTWDGPVEEHIFEVLYDVYANRKHNAIELPAVKPTVAEILEDPSNLTFHLTAYDPDYPMYSYDDIVDVYEDVAELEALHRWAMVLHNQYPWNREQVRLTEVGRLKDDDYVVAFHPRTREAERFLRRVRSGQAEGAAAPAPKAVPRPRVEAQPPRRPYAPVHVPSHFKIMPRLESLAVAKGEYVCTNEDLIRNSAYSWSPMQAAEISAKTGIEQRLYSSRTLDELALDAAQKALRHAGREPDEIGAVLFCSCTSSRMMPSVATWLSGELGMYQTYASFDLVAACAGLPYGLSEATRLLQEVERPVLLVTGEKFSDKIGTVRPSRMIFGDGAAAMVIAPAPPGEPSDIEYLQTYASGPVSQVNSIVWPNPAFDNNLTVYGPEVKALAGRYLRQMIEEIGRLPDKSGNAGSVLETIELIVPHQANKTMVIDLAGTAGLTPDQLYFNIDKVGNISSASIPTAIADAVAAGVIDRPMRIFAPGFGAGAVGGYSLMRVDPAIVATDEAPHVEHSVAVPSQGPATKASDDVAAAFGG